MIPAATVLYLCISPTWLACAVTSLIDYETPQACSAALAQMVVTNKGSVVAYCRPKQTEKPQ